MHSYAPRRAQALVLVVLGLMLLAPGEVRADALANYTIQVIARVGHRAAGFAPYDYILGPQLNDNGQIAFITDRQNGSIALVQYSDGKFSTVAAAGGPAPNGKTWPESMGLYIPTDMNQAGDIAFSPAVVSNGQGMPEGAYLWKYQAQAVSAVAVRGMPAVGNRNFDTAGGGVRVNDQGQITFTGWLKDANNESHAGIFVGGQDQNIQAVVLPGDPLPDGGADNLRDAASPFISDDGRVCFAATTRAGGGPYAYLWEKGTTTVIANGGTEIPGAGKVISAFADGFNKQNRNLLVNATVADGGPSGFYLWSNGLFIPLATTGQPMPGGGKCTSGLFNWGFANEAGRYPFVVNVDENGVTHKAAYLADESGKVSLVVKDGMTTDLGPIKVGGRSSFGIAINGKGQIALTGLLNNGPDALLLLTPKTP
jgi:hypothetical protein